ncbi:MAG: NifU family protein, partial [Candidatus Puniceispirillaceae bacterium]
RIFHVDFAGMDPKWDNRFCDICQFCTYIESKTCLSVRLAIVVRLPLSECALPPQARAAFVLDGGDIVFHSFDDGVVTLQMRGACSGCPSSTATLKMGIENMMRHYIPEVREVRPAEM